MFPTTRTSLLTALRSADSEERSRAFDTLVTVYWRPLYKYARTRDGRASHDAEDLTQSFLTRVLERDSLASFDPAKASFRTFLRLLFDRHMTNAWKAGARLKRGGLQATFDVAEAEAEIARESNAAVNPEEEFEREWVRSIFSLAVDRLRTARPEWFAIFEAYDLQENPQLSYRDLAERFDIAETTVTNRLAAMRTQFRAIVLDILREATASEREFRSEARALLGVRV